MQTYHSLKTEENSSILDVIQLFLAFLLEIGNELSTVCRWWRWWCLIALISLRLPELVIWCREMLMEVIVQVKRKLWFNRDCRSSLWLLVEGVLLLSGVLTTIIGCLVLSLVTDLRMTLVGVIVRCLTVFASKRCVLVAWRERSVLFFHDYKN